MTMGGGGGSRVELPFAPYSSLLITIPQEDKHYDSAHKGINITGLPEWVRHHGSARKDKTSWFGIKKSLKNTTICMKKGKTFIP